MSAEDITDAILNRPVDFPAFEAYFVTNAARLLRLEELLSRPSVIFDRGARDLYVAVDQSGKDSVLKRKIASGEMIPINADDLYTLSTFHSIFYAVLAASNNIPIIPTYINNDGQVYRLENDAIATIPNVSVVKTILKDGKFVAHRGEGVSVVKITEEERKSILLKDAHSVVQPFVLPPGDIVRGITVRDIRVYIVGGEPVVGRVHKAKEPLRPENISGEVLPNSQQIPSGQNRGEFKILSGQSKDRAFAAARKVIKCLENAIRLRNQRFSPYSIFGFGSVDFLLDSNYNLLPVDLDVNPNIVDINIIPTIIAQAMAKFLHNLAFLNESGRRVILIGSLNDEFLMKIMSNLSGLKPKVGFEVREEIRQQAIEEWQQYNSPRKNI